MTKFTGERAKELGSRGGKKTRRKYGVIYLRELARKGGNTPKKLSTGVVDNGSERV